MKEYIPGGVNLRYRSVATDPLNNRIHIRLLEVGGGDSREEAHMSLTLPMMFEFMRDLSTVSGDYCRRGDIVAALKNTDSRKLSEIVSKGCRL